MSPHRIALLFNANKIYDRQIIAGIGDYLKSTRVVWDLFMEEDFLSRTVGIQHWRGDGIIADDDGVVVIPQAEAEEIAKRAWRVQDKDRRQRRAFYEQLGMSYDATVTLAERPW